MNENSRINHSKDEGIAVSVIIPVYNRVSELRRAIQSVLSQTWQPVEILVVDDGSEQDIETVCASFHDDRVRYLRNPVHKNANVARNRGIREARGEYIAMLDSDDEFLPSHLERRLAKIREWDCDGIVGGAYVIEHGRKRAQSSRPLKPGELMINYLLSDGFAPTPSHFYKARAAQAVLWDETLERHQDLDFLVRFSESFSLRVDPEPTVLIHWEYHARKDYKLDSCMAFIERHRHAIDQRVYGDYHRGMYHKIYDFERPAYVEHYAAESYRHIRHVSFRSFYQVHKHCRRSVVALAARYLFLRLSACLRR
jgi:glycosyltransferase involved in cell wall biosynthesis